MKGARMLVRALADPPSVLSLDSAGWTALLATARAELLIGSLAHRLAGVETPLAAAAILDDVRRSIDQARIHALWEAEMGRRALADVDAPVVLLKGTAYAAAGLEAGIGRSIGDLDILVPREALDRVEGALLAAGWEWVKDDPYDKLYYRRWMHELPPLIHRTRDRMIDVHHNILPLTARPKPEPQALIADSVPLANGLRVLAPPDMIVHAAAHLFADGDLAGGLRNLWDIDRLMRQFAGGDFPERLRERAVAHGLAPHVARALRLSRRIYGTPVEAGRDHATDALYARRLLAREGWGRTTHNPLRFAFYVRSHWIRMPPLRLARHLLIKARA
jgi:hypothetical protein